MIQKLLLIGAVNLIVTHKLPPVIGQLRNLEILGLANNQLKQLPEYINQLAYLHHLNLKNNMLTRLPSNLQTLSEKGQLQCEGNPVCVLPQENWFSDIALKHFSKEGDKL